LAATKYRPPALRDDEMLVEVHAVGLNPIDNMITTGMFKPPRLPARAN
jgi:NADPH:quinone reductase-like Zn-dependent oxidoreductase